MAGFGHEDGEIQLLHHVLQSLWQNVAASLKSWLKLLRLQVEPTTHTLNPNRGDIPSQDVGISENQRTSIYGSPE